jgi:3-oxoacyl-[acyl-carrier-protein] synthase II
MTKQLTPRRVVITGMGLVTPLAVGTEESWQAVVNGVSGCNEITLVDHADFKVHFAHEVKDFEPTDWFNDPKTAKRCDRFVHFAVASAKMAWKDAALPADFDSTRVGCVYASGIGGILSIEEQYRKFSTKGPNRVSPFTIPLLMTNCSSGQIAIELGLQGPNYTPVSACASGGHAIGLAMRHIQWGEADIMLTGGAEAGISELGLCGFANMKALSTRNDDPKTASRPFDKDRDGFVMGEGGGALVLESQKRPGPWGDHLRRSPRLWLYRRRPPHHRTERMRRRRDARDEDRHRERGHHARPNQLHQRTRHLYALQ